MFRARQVMDGLSGSLAATLLCSCIGVAAGARGTYVAGPTKGRSASTAYAIRVGNGPALGRVRVWSAGVTHAGEDDLLVDVHLRIRNDSDAEMQLDVRATELQLIADDGSVEVVSLPTYLTGTTRIAAHASGQVGLRYALPDDLSAEEVQGFDLDWTVKTADGPFSEVTSFASQRRTGEALVYWPVYDPWWWGWGPYVGFGFGGGFYHGGPGRPGGWPHHGGGRWR